jgi:hypothetical protein
LQLTEIRMGPKDVAVVVKLAGEDKGARTTEDDFCPTPHALPESLERLDKILSS